MVWVKRIGVFLLLLLIAGATFARRGSRAPVIDAESGVLPSLEQLGDSEVIVFVLDSPLDPAFVLGDTLTVRRDNVSHGSLVGRVVRRYCRVPLVGLTAEDFDGAADQANYLQGLRLVRRFCRENPRMRVLVNISLGMEQTSEERRLIAELRTAGAMVIAAAGNDNENEPVFPAAYPNTIAVASAGSDGKALHSNYGGWIDIAASGDITFVDEEFLPYKRIREEMSARGTSFAAPRVTAALAWLFQRDADMSAEEAWQRLEDATTPMADDYYEKGQMGAGYLDIYRLKTAVQPAYRWLHFGLPLIFFCLVGAMTIFVVWRLKVAGVFVALLIWLAALPAGLGLAIVLKRYFECVKAGYQAEGPWPITIALVAFAGGAAIVRRSVMSQIRGLLPGLIVAIALRLAGVPSFGRSLLVGCVFIGGAVIVERHIRRRIASIRRVPRQRPLSEAVETLAVAYKESWDVRVKRAACIALGELPQDEVLEYVENRELAGEDVGPMVTLLEEKGWLEASAK